MIRVTSKQIIACNPCVRACALLTLAIVGCAKKDSYGLGKTIPVEGTVFLEGKPLMLPSGASGKVWYYPDSSKGNTCPQVPVGTVNRKGRYNLFTRDVEGAPPGWYKVMVVVTAPVAKKAGKRASLVSSCYGHPDKSGLFIHVVDDPGNHDYDLLLAQ